MRSRGEIEKSEKRVVGVYLLHIELLRSGLELLVLHAARENSWTCLCSVVCCVLFATNWKVVASRYLQNDEHLPLRCATCVVPLLSLLAYAHAFRGISYNFVWSNISGAPRALLQPVHPTYKHVLQVP
jgi:hypothetical protein